MKPLLIQMILGLLRHAMTASPFLSMVLEGQDLVQWATNAAAVAGVWWSMRRKSDREGVKLWDLIRGKVPAIVLVALVPLLMIAAAHARDLTVTWTPPSTFEDGSALDPATDLAEYRFYCDTTQVYTAPNIATTIVMTDFRPQPCDLHATAVAIWGGESGMSNVVAVDGLRPRPPTLLEAIVAWVRRLFSWFA